MSSSSQSSPQQPSNVFQQSTYNAVKKLLTDTIKKIQNYETRRDLPQDPKQRDDRIHQYTRKITGTYNNFIAYINLFYHTFTLESQFNTNETVARLKLKVKKSLNILKLDVVLPENLEKINIDTVKSLDINLNNTNDLTNTGTSSSVRNSQEDNEIQNNSDLDEISETQDNIVVQGGDVSVPPQQQNNTDPPREQINSNIQENNIHEMALTPGDLLRGIPDFDSKSQESVKKFIAQVDLSYIWQLPELNSLQQIN